MYNFVYIFTKTIDVKIEVRMPSRALRKYEGAMMRDVSRIIETHGTIQNGAPGNMGLGHLTRAGVLLLCAAWELYVEEVLIESVECCISRCDSPDSLPQVVKKNISDYVRASKHDFKPIAMAGDGWKNIYLEMARDWVSGLNTPKSHNIDQGFLFYLGMTNVSSNWSFGTDAINRFVSARGDVAHRGSDAGNIHMNVLRDSYVSQVTRCAIEMDNAISTYIRGAFMPNVYPWNRRAL
jgi:hypothetical protein